MRPRFGRIKFPCPECGEVRMLGLSEALGARFGLVFVLAIYTVFVDWVFAIGLALALIHAVATPMNLDCPNCGAKRQGLVFRRLFGTAETDRQLRRL